MHVIIIACKTVINISRLFSCKLIIFYLQLENMSPEDLLKTNKKQLLFLQKLKAKCDDLQSKLTAQSDYDQVCAITDEHGCYIDLTVDL